MHKYILYLILSALPLATYANDDVNNLNDYLNNKFNLNTELLSWLIVNGKSNATKSREFWNETGGIPWQLKELEERGYIYIIIREYPEYNNQIGYSTSIASKAAPLLKSTKDYKQVDEESILNSFEKESINKHTTYISPEVKSKLLKRKKGNP